MKTVKEINPMDHPRYDELKEMAKKGDVGAKALLDGMAELYENFKEEDPIGYEKSLQNEGKPDYMEPKFRIDEPIGPIGWKWVNLREKVKENE